MSGDPLPLAGVAPSPSHLTGAAGGQARHDLAYGDYLRLRQLVEERSGLYFPEKRWPELEMGLRQAFSASTCADLDSYYRLLSDPSEGALEMDRLVNALTVGETYFFRDAGQFDALYNHVLPQLIERQRQARCLRLWSAACASGEEPYSLAILLRELLPDVDRWTITILATDINTESLDRARRAVYGDWAFREERARYYRSRYFRFLTADDSHLHAPRSAASGRAQAIGRSGYELAPEVRRMVTFARLNLASDDYPTLATNTTLMDLVLCRNATIYFDEPVTKHVVERLYGALADGGWLAVGYAEASSVTYRRFQAHSFPNAVLYQRLDQAKVSPVPGWRVGLRPSETGVPSAAPAGKPGKVSPPAGTVRPPTPIATDLAAAGDPLDRAADLLEYGRLDEARNLLLELVAQRQSGQATACALLGRAYANLGQWPEAERWCSESVRLDRLMLEAYYTLALVLQHQGRLDEAIDAMKKVVYIDHNHVLGHYGLAGLYHSQGDLARALRSLGNARRLLEAGLIAGQGDAASAAVLPSSGGITADRLREAILRQQQRWGGGSPVAELQDKRKG